VLVEDVETGIVLGLRATPAAETAAGLGFVFVNARAGPLTAATTSPATSFSAGATPEERVGFPPPGSRSSDRAIDTAASVAGTNELVTGACSFILGAPSAATRRRVELRKP
jgi:hypothetical protein